MKSLPKNQSRQIELPFSLAHCNRKHFFDENFFAVPDLINSYWAGFVGADGCVVKNKRASRVGLGLQASDRPHLEKLLADCGYFGSGAISLYETNYVSKQGERSQSVRVDLASKQWVDDLERNYNITPLKTLTLQPPSHLDRQCSLAYLAGLLDGDGTVRICKMSANFSALKISLCGASRPILEWAKLLIDEIAPSFDNRQLTTVKEVGKGANKLFHLEVTGGKDAKVELKLASLNLPLLKRKWGKATAFIQERYGDGMICDRRETRASAEIVQKIRSRLAAGEDRKALAKEYDLSVSLVHRIASGEKWKRFKGDGLEIPVAHRNPKELPIETVQAIKALLALPEYQIRGGCSKIADQFEVKVQVIRDIKKGRTYRSVA